MRIAIIQLIFIITLPLSSYSQIISTYAGNGISGNTGDGGMATNARITTPHFLAIDKSGSVYFSQFVNGGTIRKVLMDGTISTVVGPGVIGILGDGSPATNAYLKWPDGVAFDTAGNLFLSDRQNYRIRKIDKNTGIISTYAGNGIAGSLGDGGPAIAASFFPSDICFDNNNNLYITDNTYHRIRIVNAIGTISTYAGTGVSGFAGDGGLATAAQVNGPAGITTDMLGNVFFADGQNKRLRKIDTHGIISTISGTGVAVYNGDGIPAIFANIGPLDVAVDLHGNIFITDSCHRIRKIDTFGTITTIAGTGVSGYDGDGVVATSAKMYNPGGIVVDLCGNIFFADVSNSRVRKIELNSTFIPPSITLESPPLPIPMGTTVTVTATVSSAGSSYLIRWMNRGIEFATTTVPTVTYTKGPGTDTITARVVSTATYGCYDSTTSAPHYVHEGTVGVAYTPATATSLRLYPNPAHTQLTISTTEPITSLSITNVLGQVVAAPPGLPQGEVIAPPFLPRGEVTVPVGHLPMGVYLVRVNGVYVQRFVKE